MSKQEIFQLKDVQETYSQVKPKVVMLKDANGKVIVGMTMESDKTKGKVVNEKWNKIKELLSSKRGLEPGIYFISFMNSYSHHSKRTVFPVQYNTTDTNVEMSEPAPKQPVKSDNAKEAIYDMKSLLELMAENTKLQLRNEALTKDVKELEDEIADLEAELSIQGKNMSEKSPSDIMMQTKMAELFTKHSDALVDKFLNGDKPKEQIAAPGKERKEITPEEFTALIRVERKFVESVLQQMDIEAEQNTNSNPEHQ